MLCRSLGITVCCMGSVGQSFISCSFCCTTSAPKLSGLQAEVVLYSSFCVLVVWVGLSLGGWPLWIAALSGLAVSLDVRGEGWNSSFRGVSCSSGNCSRLIHVAAEEFPATRENKPHFASPFPVSASVIFPYVLWAPAGHAAKPESLLAGSSRGCGCRDTWLLSAVTAAVYSKELSRVLPEIKSLTLSALFAFLLQTVTWDGDSQWFRHPVPRPTWGSPYHYFTLRPATLQRRKPSGSQIDGYASSRRTYQKSVAGSAQTCC